MRAAPPNNRFRLQLGVFEADLLFKFQNKEILSVFDPPHVLKCTRNVVRRNDVQLGSEHLDNQLPVIAKWEHILNVYLYKLTDSPQPCGTECN
jgi:hypothetical protein